MEKGRHSDPSLLFSQSPDYPRSSLRPVGALGRKGEFNGELWKPPGLSYKQSRKYSGALLGNLQRASTRGRGAPYATHRVDEALRCTRVLPCALRPLPLSRSIWAMTGLSSFSKELQVCVDSMSFRIPFLFCSYPAILTPSKQTKYLRRDLANKLLPAKKPMSALACKQTDWIVWCSGLQVLSSGELTTTTEANGFYRLANFLPRRYRKTGSSLKIN